jgi:hypothetical protein
MVNDWVGLIEHHNKPIETLCIQLNKMNVEDKEIIDPIEKEDKFAAIHIEDQ